MSRTGRQLRNPGRGERAAERPHAVRQAKVDQGARIELPGHAGGSRPLTYPVALIDVTDIDGSRRGPQRAADQKSQATHISP